MTLPSAVFVLLTAEQFSEEAAQVREEWTEVGERCCKELECR
jgi:hypothetical protein